VEGPIHFFPHPQGLIVARKHVVKGVRSIDKDRMARPCTRCALSMIRRKEFGGIEAELHSSKCLQRPLKEVPPVD
jgi:hypothetical protein